MQLISIVHTWKVLSTKFVLIPNPFTLIKYKVVKMGGNRYLYKLSMCFKLKINYYYFNRWMDCSIKLIQFILVYLLLVFMKCE